MHLITLHLERRPCIYDIEIPAQIEIKRAYELGMKEIGENRVQEAMAKYEILKDLDITWHMVGHLQRNKAKYAVRFFEYIHSLDSLKLAEELDKRAKAQGIAVKVFIQVNVSGEETKFGIDPRDVDVFVDEVLKYENLDLVGFMTIAPIAEDPEEVRPYFRKLREIRDKISNRLNKGLYLSMGMTQDFEVAIEEGADFLRIGRAIFEG